MARNVYYHLTFTLIVKYISDIVVIGDGGLYVYERININTGSNKGIDSMDFQIHNNRYT